MKVGHVRLGATCVHPDSVWADEIKGSCGVRSAKRPLCRPDNHRVTAEKHFIRPSLVGASKRAQMTSNRNLNIWHDRMQLIFAKRQSHVADECLQKILCLLLNFGVLSDEGHCCMPVRLPRPDKTTFACHCAALDCDKNDE